MSRSGNQALQGFVKIVVLVVVFCLSTAAAIAIGLAVIGTVPFLIVRIVFESPPAMRGAVGVVLFLVTLALGLGLAGTAYIPFAWLIFAWERRPTSTTGETSR